MAAIKVLLALVAAMLLVSGATAYGGRRLACTTPGCLPTTPIIPCVNYQGGMSSSTSATTFASDFTTAFSSCFKSVCDNGECINEQDCTDQSVTVTAEALAVTEVAMAETCAQAMVRVMGRGFVSGPADCTYTSTASAAAKARALAKAMAGSYAAALTRVAGSPDSAAYSLVMATYNNTVSTFQQKCDTTFAVIAPETVDCKVTSTPCREQKPDGTWKYNVYTQTFYQKYLTVNFNAQMDACKIVDCCFTNKADDATAVARVATQAIADAMSELTINAAESCTYDGAERTCTPFANLCDSTCTSGQCPTPTFKNTVCEKSDEYGQPVSGVWQKLSNGFYACNYCGTTDEVETGDTLCGDNGCVDACTCVNGLAWDCA